MRRTTLDNYQVKLVQATAVIALSFTVIFQYLIVKAYLTGPDWKILLDFNAMHEGYLEMLVVFPLCLLISAWMFVEAYRLG